MFILKKSYLEHNGFKRHSIKLFNLKRLIKIDWLKNVEFLKLQTVRNLIKIQRFRLLQKASNIYYYIDHFPLISSLEFCL